MTAVQMAIVGQRFTISGEGYSPIGQIAGEAGKGEVPLERYLLPMALCADAVAKDGGLVGDPTEGALVVLAPGGVDRLTARSTRGSPRCRSTLRTSSWPRSIG